jgi:arylsulfatase A-like enzyme
VLELCEDSHNPARRAVIQGDYKLVALGSERGKRMLFNLAQDPGELTDLSRTELAKLAELSSALDAAFAKIERVEPYGGNKLQSGRVAQGPRGPANGEKAQSN